MPLKVPYASSLLFADNDVLGLLDGAELCLFNVSHTPSNSDVTATYTAIEASFGGYARIPVSDWSTAALDAANRASVNAGVKTFTATGASLPQSVYGVFLLSMAGDLLYAEANPTGAVVLSSAGNTYSYQPVFTGKSEF